MKRSDGEHLEDQDEDLTEQFPLRRVSDAFVDSVQMDQAALARDTDISIKR